MGGFTMSNVLKGESQMDRHISLFMQKMRHFADRGENVEFARWSQWLAFDVAMDMSFSNPLGCVEKGEDVNGTIAALHSMLTGVAWSALFPWITNTLHQLFFWKHLAPHPNDGSEVGKLFGLAYDSVDKRLQLLDGQGSLDTKPTDILQWILDHEDSQGQHIPIPVPKEEASSPVLAGSDSSAGNLRAIVLYTVTNPRVHAKLVSQIDAADARGLLSPIPTWDEITRHVPYIEPIRKESLRLHPVVGSPLFRRVPSGGVTLSPNHHLPATTEVGLSQYAIGRNPAIWGPDADLFRPERWTDDPDPDARRRRVSGDIFFGSGLMMCTGRNVAALEISKTIVELFRRFDVALVRPERPWHLTVTLAWIHGDYWLSLRPRAKAEAPNSAS